MGDKGKQLADEDRQEHHQVPSAPLHHFTTLLTLYRSRNYSRSSRTSKPKILSIFPRSKKSGACWRSTLKRKRTEICLLLNRRSSRMTKRRRVWRRSLLVRSSLCRRGVIQALERIRLLSRLWDSWRRLSISLLICSASSLIRVSCKMHWRRMLLGGG